MKRIIFLFAIATIFAVVSAGPPPDEDPLNNNENTNDNAADAAVDNTVNIEEKEKGGLLSGLL